MKEDDLMNTVGLMIPTKEHEHRRVLQKRPRPEALPGDWHDRRAARDAVRRAAGYEVHLAGKPADARIYRMLPVLVVLQRRDGPSCEKNLGTAFPSGAFPPARRRAPAADL